MALSLNRFSCYLSDQIFWCLWYLQECIERIHEVFNRVSGSFKYRIFEDFACHTVRYSDGVAETIYNYDTLWGMFSIFIYKYFHPYDVPMFKFDTQHSDNPEQKVVRVCKGYLYDRSIFKVSLGSVTVSSADKRDEDEKATFHHLHTPHTMVFLTSANATGDIEEFSTEFKEIGLLLSKLGLTVKEILIIIEKFYNKPIKTKDPVLNLILPPKIPFCAYKESEKIDI